MLSKMKQSLNDLQSTLAEQKIEIAERVKKLFSGAQAEGNVTLYDYFLTL